MHLVTDPISKFTPLGIEISNKSSPNEVKELIELDIVIMATGFDPVGSFASAFDMGGDISFDKDKELFLNAPKAYLGSCLVREEDMTIDHVLLVLLMIQWC